MPVPARRVPSGTIVVGVSVGEVSGRTVVYVGVSSHHRRPDLEARAGRVVTWCARQAHWVDAVAV
jgi:putative resolvase